MRRSFPALVSALFLIPVVPSRDAIIGPDARRAGLELCVVIGGWVGTTRDQRNLAEDSPLLERDLTCHLPE